MIDTESEIEAQPFIGQFNLPLHHVGVVVPGFPELEALMGLLGMEEDYRGFVPTFSAWCVFTRALGRSPIEFVVPEGGPLERFNKGAGGLHHIALETPNIAALAARLQAQGMALIEPQPVKGAGDFLCNFLSPVYTRGLTVEFVQLL